VAINLLIVLNLLVFVGVSGSRILFSLYGLNLGATASGVGSIMAMLYVFPLLLSWPIGALSDRMGPRRLLIGGTVSGVVGMLIPYFFPGLVSLYIAAALLGLTMAFVSVIGQTLIGSLSKPSERTKNFSNYGLTGSFCNLVGPIAAGLAIDHLGFGDTCLIISVPLLLSVALLLAYGKVLNYDHAPTKVPKGNLLATLADRRLWRMLAISSLVQLGFDLFQTFLPIYAHGIGLSASAIGIVLAAISVGSFAVRVTVLRLISLLGEEGLLATAFCCGAVVFTLVPFAHSAATLVTLALVFGISVGCCQPLVMMLMFSSIGESRAGEAVGLRLTVNNLVRISGPVIFGAVGTAIGLKAVFWINGLFMASGGYISKPNHSKKQRKH